jgi:hypothetical protein
VAGALQDAICATFCTRHNALHARAFVYENFRNFQVVDVSAIVVLSVSNGRFQNFLHQYRSFLLVKVRIFRALTLSYRESGQQQGEPSEQKCEHGDVLL